MKNIEIVKKLILLDKQIEIKQQELNLLRHKRYLLKSQIKANDVDIEEFTLKEKILKKEI